MEIRHLRYFVAVAEELHFGRAAQRVHIEQSPLSRAIKALEVDVGARLLERTTRTTRLTSAGKAFLPEAQLALDILEQAKAKALSAANGYGDCLRIGMTESIPDARIAQAISHHQYPANPLQLLVLPAHAVVEKLQKGLIDIGVIHSRPNCTGITSELLWSAPVMALLSIDNPLSDREHVSLNELARHPLILSGPDFGQEVNRCILSAFEDLRLTPEWACRASTHVGLLTLTAANYGVGFIVESQKWQFQLAGIKTCALPAAVRDVPTYALWKGKTPSRQVAQFLQNVRHQHNEQG